jgi:hypothetical protein
MKEYHLFPKYKITFINFPETNKSVQGVYRINGVYVGASTHIRKRIIQHINSFERGIKNIRLDSTFKSNKPINVILESYNPMDEEIISKKYGLDRLNEKFYNQGYLKNKKYGTDF